MKKLFSILAVICLSIFSAIAGIFIYNNFILKPNQQQSHLNPFIEKYLQSNAQKVFEIISQNNNFEEAVRQISTVDEAKIVEIIDKRLAEKNKNSVLESENEPKLEKGQTDDDANNLYKQHWNKLINNEVAPSVGPKDAKVTVVEFFDFACGHCKALAPIMSQIIKDNPDVRFIFNPLYFISEHSPYAAKVSLAAAKKGKFAEVFDGIMTLPKMDETAINQILADEGLDIDEIKKMIEEKDIRRGLQEIDSLSQVLEVNGVPMLIINGEAFYGRNIKELQNKINSYK